MVATPPCWRWAGSGRLTLVFWAMSTVSRATFGGDVLVDGDARRDGVVAEAPSLAGGEHRVTTQPAPLLAPHPQDGDVGGGQWDTTLLAAVAVAADVSSVAQLDAAAGDPVSSESRRPVCTANAMSSSRRRSSTRTTMKRTLPLDDEKQLLQRARLHDGLLDDLGLLTGDVELPEGAVEQSEFVEGVLADVLRCRHIGSWKRLRHSIHVRARRVCEISHPLGSDTHLREELK